MSKGERPDAEFRARLIQERNRMGLNQEQFGALGGVARIAQLNYEKGYRTPSVAYLQNLFRNGVNIDYIQHGQNRLDCPQTAVERKAAVAVDVIEALHDVDCVISEAINEFSDKADKAALRDGLQQIIDVAIAHDLRGNYGIFIGEDSEGGDLG